MGPSLELTEAERKYTPSWDGIPVVEVPHGFFFSLVGFFVALISDLTYAWIDPRIDFETRAA